MEKLLNKLKELIKEDEQIGTPIGMYSWAKQQGVLITRNDASYIVLLLERLAKVANEVPGTLPIFDVVGQSEQLRACKLIDKCSNPGTLCRKGKNYACYK